MNFFNNVLRSEFPNARIVDVIGISPTRATVVIEGDNPDFDFGFVSIWARYTGAELVTFFQVSPFSGSVQYPGDQNLTLTEAADEFIEVSASNSLFVGRIDSLGQCQPVIERSAQTPRALGSIFKMWVLAALAERLNDGLSNPEDDIALVASELAAGGIINNEPLGTQFSVRDMAILMLSFSDNTSTDHLHELVGRNAIADQLTDFGLSQPDLLLPFLNISEQFHVFSRFNLPTAQSYVNGTLAFREQFLVDEIIPEGPSHPIKLSVFFPRKPVVHRHLAGKCDRYLPDLRRPECLAAQQQRLRSRQPGHGLPVRATWYPQRMATGLVQGRQPDLRCHWRPCPDPRLAAARKAVRHDPG